MPAGSVARAGKAALLIGCFVASTFVLSRALDFINLAALYQNQFAFTPGDWFAWKLSAAEEASDQTCLLIGASSVREGLDTEIIEQQVPGLQAVNAATTGAGGSAVEVVEIQARTLATRGVHYKCIALGVHPMFLRRFDPGKSYDITTTDYAAVLTLADIFGLALPPWQFAHAGVVGYKYLVPFGRHSLQLKRLLRLGLYRGHRDLINRSVTPESYEEFEGEFAPQGQYLYAGPSVLKDIETSYAADIARLRWNDPASYGGIVEAGAFQNVLRLLSALTDRLVLVEMPESSLFDEVNELARPALVAAVRGSDVSLSWIRCSIPRSSNYELFHDAIHLNAEGRGRLTRELAYFLATGLVSDEPAKLCNKVDEALVSH